MLGMQAIRLRLKKQRQQQIAIQSGTDNPFIQTTHYQKHRHSPLPEPLDIPMGLWE